MQSAKSVGFMPISVGHGKTTPKPGQFDTALAKGANIIDLQSAAPTMSTNPT